MKDKIVSNRKIGAIFLTTIMVLTAFTTMTILSGSTNAIVGGCCPPVADANGPYLGWTNTPVSLDGSGSYDIDGTIVSWEWDLDNDGYYDDASGETVDHTWTTSGKYTIGLKVTDNDGFSDTDTTTVRIVEENPELLESCGIDICLVIDSSGSIDDDELATMKDAFIDFVDALLPNTPTMMSVVDFDTTATVLQVFTSNITKIKDAINTPTSGGCTNWEDALTKAYSTFDPRIDKPDLIIFASDGNPNTVIGGSGCGSSEEDAVDAAIAVANMIKSDGIRIITLGIGNNLDPENLKAISSPDAYYDSDFDILADTLSDIASELCGGTISVKKLVDGEPAAGWEFTATVTGGTAIPSSGTTGSDGFIQFSIELDDGVETAYVTITETPQSGYNLLNAFAENCSGDPVGTWSGYSIVDIPVTANCAIYCEFSNEEQTDDCPPTTEKTFCGPYYPAEDYPNPDYGPDMGEHYWVTTSTEITLHATDCPDEDASGVDYIWYEVWWDSDNDNVVDTQVPVNIIEQGDDYVTFTFMEECLHEIWWYAVDKAGNEESMHIQQHRVDDTGPNQSIALGDPKIEDFYHHPNGNDYTIVGPNTPIYITSDDTHDTNGTPKACAVGSNWLEYIVTWGNEWNNWTHSRGPYRIYDGDPEDIDDTPGVITVVEYMPESCWHEIHVWCEDNLGNTGVEKWMDFIVDADEPVQNWEYIGPELWMNDEHYISNVTIKRINVTDEGCIPGGSGAAELHWKVQRIIGPNSVITIAEDIVYDDEDYYFDNDLVVVTGDNDPDYGEISIDIMIDDHCEHYIWHQATDYMDNTGTFYKQKVRVDKKPPITTKTIGDPKYDGGYWVTTSTPIYLDAVDQEEPCVVGVKEIHYRYGYDQDDSGDVEENEFYDWVIVPGDHAEFYFTEECLHKLEWYAVDYLGNTEEIHWQYHKVDDTPPMTTKTIGDPKYDMGYWVTTSTLFELDAVDLPPDCPAGVEQICYRIGWDENQDEVFDENEFTDWTCVDGDHVEFYLGEECYHKLEWYSIDNLGHQEETHWQYHKVDDTPPTTTKTISGPTCGPDDFWVTTSTAITLTAIDEEEPCAVGVWYIHYEIWWDSDNDNVVDTKLVDENINDDHVTFYFTEECLHEIRWYAVDYLGNTEPLHTQQHRVDDTPPETIKFIDTPKYGEDDYWVTTSTPITLIATDYTEPCAVWGITIHYEIWWDSDNDNVVDTKLVDENINDDHVTFYFTEECLHEIRWYAVDCLGNQEEMHIQQHRVDDTPPTTTKTFNGPTYGENNFWLQDHGTTIILDSTDNTDPCAVGVDYIHVELWKYDEIEEIWNQIWSQNIQGNHYEFTIDEDCYHKIIWYAVDYLGNTETTHEQYHRVDSQPPITEKTVNDPWCGLGYYYVTTHTLIELDAVDQEEPCVVGVKEIHYRYGYDQDDSGDVEENEFYDWVIVPGDHAEFYFTEECLHKLEWYAVDYLGNTEDVKYQYHKVDDTPPTTTKTFNGPTYGDNYWVTTSTAITLTATDYEEPCAVGEVTLYWEVWWDSDNDNVVDTQVPVNIIEQGDDYVTFTFMEECLHEIRYYAVDCLGNTEPLHTQQHRVDDTPPTTTKTISGPTYGENNFWLQDHGTTIILDSTDNTDPCAVGVDYIHVELWKYDEIEEIWNQIWSQNIQGNHYEFTIDEDCYHKIIWYAVDYLGNTETTHEQYHRVDSQPPITEKTFSGPTCPASEEDIQKFNLETQEEIDNFWLRDHDTWVILTAVDQQEPCAVGVDYIHVELWRSIDEGENWDLVWSNDVYDTYYEFQIMEDCLHKIVWYAVDYLGNTETTHVQYHRVDSQPPESVKTFEGYTYPAEDYPNEFYGPDLGEHYWVKSNTSITLTAVDQEEPCAVGVVGFNVKVEWDQYCDGNFVTIFDESIPAPYTYTFTFKELVDNYQGGNDGGCDGPLCEPDCYEGIYRITWSAYDCLGNTETPKVQYHQVDDTPPHVVILKPVDGWYSDGSSIPTVVLSEDLPNIHCGQWSCGTVGIEEGKQGKAWLIDVFPDFNITELDTTNLLYNSSSHEYIGNAIIPNPSNIPDGIVLFVAGSEDNLGNNWNSLFEILHAYYIQALAECVDPGSIDCLLETFADLIADFIADQNIVWIGIDNTPPEVEILDVQVDVGSIYVEANATDVLSGIESGTPCYVTVGGVTIGTLPYDTNIGGCQGTLPLAGAPDGEQTLSVCVADRAGSVGCDSEIVDLIPLPGPTTTGTDVQPDSSIIGTTLTVNATTFSSIATIADADYYIIDYYGNIVATGHLSPVDGVFDETSEDITTTIDTSDWEAGSYTIFVRGQDSFGKWGAYDEEEFSLVEEAQWRPVVCNILYPENDEEFNVECGERYIHVVVDAYRPAYNGLPKDHEVDVIIWLDQPYGAPDLFYDVAFDGEYYTADIPVYWYSNGAELNLEAKAEDQYGNRAYDDTTFTVFTTVEYDHWMKQGWNGPINLALLGCSNATEDVFSSIDPYYDYVFEVGTWKNYWHNQPDPGMNGGTLQTISRDAWYWVHMTQAARFYIDMNPPYVEIIDPDEEYDERCEGPSSLDYVACEIETRTVMVYTQIYDHNGSYWNGEGWQSTPVWLECELDDEDEYTGWSYWFYESDDIWIQGHTYDILAYAVDASGCSSDEDEKTMHIYDTSILVEKTVGEGQEELTIAPDTPFTFTIYVENNGDISLEDVEVFDYLPYNFTYLDDAKISFNGDPFIGYEPDITYNDVQELYWYIDEGMAPGEYLILKFNASITSCDVWEENIATVYGYSICDTVSDTDNVYVKGECCIPSLELEKTVWRDDLGCWDFYTEVDVGDTVRFNITIYVPEDGCPLYNGYLEDYLPNGLEYVPGSTNITYFTDGYSGHYNGTDCDPQIIPDEDYTLLLWTSEEGYGDYVPPNTTIYIEFEAVAIECGDYTNVANGTGYYDECCSISAEDSADVYVYCPIYYDFGDAPSPYPTLLADNGARHVYTAPYMGDGVDDDDDGQPTNYADGDDNDGNDDEDGVTFISPLYPGDTGWVNVSMIWTPLGGYLNAWIDFNQDGDWADTGEHIIVDDYLENGSFYELSFPIPGDAISGDTYARFRISSQKYLSYDGYAADGEVEDYKVTISGEEACEPDMEVEKLVWDGYEWVDEISVYSLYEIVEFNITIHNNASCCSLTNITVFDALPEGLEYYADGEVYYEGTILDEGYDYIFEENNGELWWNFTDYGAAGSVPYCHTISIYFYAEVVGYGDWINDVYVTADCDDTSLFEYDEAVVHLPCGMPTPEGDKTVWCPVGEEWTYAVYNVQQGDIVKFNITAYNDGCCDLTQIYIKDILPVPNLQYVQTTKVEYPAGLTYQGVEPSGNNVYWNFTGNLPNDGSKIFIEFEAEVVDTTGDYCGNQAIISGRCEGTMEIGDPFNYAYIYFIPPPQ